MKYSCFTNLCYLCCIAKWISYTYTYILCFGFPSQLGDHRAFYYTAGSHLLPILYIIVCIWGFPGSSVVKNLTAMLKTEFDPWVRKIPWRRAWQPTPVFLPGESPLRGAWRTTVLTVAKSRTQLKRLSSSSSSSAYISVPTFQFISPPPPQTLLPLAATHLFSTSVPLLLLCK